MHRNIESKGQDEVRNYVFLIFSTDEEVGNPNEVLSSIMRDDGDGFKLEKVSVLRNPAFRTF